MGSRLTRFWNRPTLRAFRSSPTGVIGAVIVLILILIAILAPLFLESRATAQNPGNIFAPAGGSHLLGTDALGRDVLARLLVATRLSMALAAASVAIALVLGTAMGVMTAILHGVARTILQRIIDTMLSFPAILKAIFVAAII